MAKGNLIKRNRGKHWQSCDVLSLRSRAQGLLNGPESTLVPAPRKAFVSEELMLVPEDTEVPPDYGQEW